MIALEDIWAFQVHDIATLCLQHAKHAKKQQKIYDDKKSNIIEIFFSE